MYPYSHNVQFPNWELKLAGVVTAGWLASICLGEKNHHAALLGLFGLINCAWELSLGKMLSHKPTKTEFCKKKGRQPGS